MDVLIVDDSPSALLLLQKLVERHGHSVTSCADGESALEVIARKAFPLIFLDWELPGIDGPDVARYIRSQRWGEASYIMMVTGRSDTEDLKAALDAGANDYIVKPIDAGLFDIRLTVAEEQGAIMKERMENAQELDALLERLARSNDDLLSILNTTRMATALCDAEGMVRFVSQTALRLFELRADECTGRHWTTVFPFKPDDIAQLQLLSDTPLKRRDKLGLQLRTAAGNYYWMDVRVEDDPRNGAARIFTFQDTTELNDLRQRLDEKSQFRDIVGKSRPMMLLYQQIQELAPSDITVLIDGETGAGKEMVARAIHAYSHRSEQPFIAVNCAGLTDSLLTSQLFGHVRGAFTGAIKDQKGLFEEANGGTLFLDEIGEVSMGMQTALLRALQEREVVRVGENVPRKVDVRIIAATNRDLDKEVAQGNFRADLMYRIRVAHLRLPPLRARLEDIPLLVNVFLTRYRAASGKEVTEISHAALRRLTEYAWPGNVRELENAIEVAAVRCKGSVIQAADLPLSLQGGGADTVASVVPEMLDTQPQGRERERQRILNALTTTMGSRKKAAALLGMSRATFYRRLSQLKIEL